MTRNSLVIFLVFVCVAPRHAQTEERVQFGPWRQTAGIDRPRASHRSFVYDGRLYVLGGYFYSEQPQKYELYADVQFAELRDDGTITAGSWVHTTPFNTGRSGFGCTVHNGTIYITAGNASTGYLDDVQYAKIKADGTLGAWKTSPNRILTPRSNHHSLVFANRAGQSYLYVIAGVGSVGARTVHFDTVEYAPISCDGSVGEWTTCAYHMKGGRSSPACVELSGRLYVIGGWGDLLIEDVFRDVQYAGFEEDGQLSPWRTNPHGLEMPLYGHGVVVSSSADDPSIIVLGGNAGEGNYFNNIQIAGLMPGGTLGNWQFSRSQFPTPRWGHTTVIHNDYVYVVAGASKGGFLQDVQVAEISAE